MSNVATARMMRGMTQAELAEKLRMTPQQLSAYESGRRNPGPKVLPAMAEALGVEESYLRGESISIPVRDFMTGAVVMCPVMSQEEIDGYGMLYVVDHPAEAVDELAVIVSGDGLQFTPDDWQSGQPHSASEIADYRWVDAYGVQAIMMDGLPRSLCLDQSVVAKISAFK